ncbi:MAG TPA: hypothetical protein VF258_06140, partial [Luteolibacter sp.]
MKSRRYSVICLGALLAIGTAVILWRHSHSAPKLSTAPARSEARAGAGHPDAAGNPESAVVGSPGVPAAAAMDAPADPQDVSPSSQPRQPDFAKLDAFDTWKTKWTNASPEERKELVAEGAHLAGERRPEYHALISFDPRQAVDRAVTRL